MGTIFKSGRAGLARAATAMALAAGIASMVAVQGASASSSGPNGMRTRDAHTTSTSGGNLVNHGGPVLETSHTYAIWWGNPAAWNSSAPVALGQLLSGFNGSNYLGIAAQYMPDAKVSSAYEGARPDGSSPPSKVSPSTLGNEVGRVYGTNIDPLGIYFVYTSNFPKGGNYCAWHSYATVNGIRVAVAYMPNTTGVAGCDPQVPANTTSYNDEGINSLANVTAHEFMESITDTQPASGTYAWIDNSGSEIGDKCAWQFSSNVALSSSTVWKLQKEWDNSISGCNQGV